MLNFKFLTVYFSNEMKSKSQYITSIIIVKILVKEYHYCKEDILTIEIYE